MNKAIKANDYSKSFSGTAADTSKEKEFADLTNTSGERKFWRKTHTWHLLAAAKLSCKNYEKTHSDGVS